MDSTLIEHFVIFKTFFGITAHTRDAIENDGIIFLYLRDELFPLRSVLGCTGKELSNDSGGGVESGDVGDLTSNLLVLGADTAIGVNHNITFLSVLNQTVVCSDAIIMSCFEPFVSPF